MNPGNGNRTGEGRSSLPSSDVKKKARLTPDSRFVLFLIALALVVAGQVIMQRDVPIDSWQDMRQSINNWLRIDAKYLGSVIFGLACSILGGILFAVASFRANLSPGNDPVFFPISGVPVLKKWHFSKWGWRTLVGFGLFAILILRAVIYELEFFDVFFWIGAIFFLSSAIFKYDRASGARTAPEASRSDVVIIILILIAGILIGTYQLQDIPNNIKGDEGSFFEVARYIADGEYRESIFGFGVYSFPAFSSFFQGAIMRLFGRDLWGWRFASLLPALLSAIPLYLLGRDFFNRWVGMIAALIYISSPYYLSFARLGYNNSQAILFVILCFWLFYQGLKRNSLFYVFLAGIVSGLGFLTYTAGKLGLLVVLASFGYALLSTLRKEGGKRFLLIALVVFMIGSAIMAAPHLIYGAVHNPEALRNKLVESLFINLDYTVGLFGEEDVYQTSTITTIDRYQVILNPDLNLRLLLRGLIRSFLGLQIDEYSTNFYLVSPLAGPISAIFYVLGLYYLLAHFWKPSGFPFLIWFLTGMGFLSIISTYPPRPAHLVAILPVLALFSGLGLYLAVDQLFQYFDSKEYAWGHWRPLLLLLGCLAILVAGAREYFIESPKTYKPNLEQVMNWAGLHNPAETKIYYIAGPEAGQEWVPYFYRIGLAQPEFESVALAAVQNGLASWPGGSDFAIFIEEYHTAELLPVFKQQLDSADFITLRDRDDRPVGRVIVNGEMRLTTDVPFWRGLGNLLTSRSVWILLPLAAVGLYQLYQSPPDLSQNKMARAYSDNFNKIKELPFFQSIKGVYSGRQEAEIPGAPSRVIEIGLFFRWGARKTKHNYELKLSLGHRKDDPDAQADNQKK